jgi:predicted MFS family arabinose efflux permease
MDSDKRLLHLGPVIVSIFIAFSGNDYQRVFWWATIPAAIAVMICIFGIQDRRPPQVHGASGEKINPLQFSQLRLLEPRYWRLLFVSAAFMAARYSESFLVLRAESVHLPVTYVPLVLVMMNITYCFTSIPIGSFADRIDKRLFLMGGFLSLVIANILLATSDSLFELGIGVAIWGLHMALTQGILLAMVANTAPSHLRGTAFGFFHLINGVGQLCGNAVLGQLWHHYGIQSAFLVSAGMLILPLMGLFFLEKTGAEQDH